MTRDVLVTISGKRLMGTDNEDVELVTPGTYSWKSGTHIVRYDEPGEDGGNVTENMILIGGGSMQIIKRGFSNVHMSFNNSSERTTSCYSTPFGDFMIGISTNDISITESDRKIRVSVDYSMDVAEQRLSDCSINVEIVSRGPSA